MKKSDLIYSYMFRNRQEIERAIEEKKTNIRFRDISMTDCIELMLLYQQLETFNETCAHIRAIMSMKNFKE